MSLLVSTIFHTPDLHALARCGCQAHARARTDMTINLNLEVFLNASCEQSQRAVKTRTWPKRAEDLKTTFLLNQKSRFNHFETKEITLGEVC